MLAPGSTKKRGRSAKSTSKAPKKKLTPARGRAHSSSTPVAGPEAESPSDMSETEFELPRSARAHFTIKGPSADVKQRTATFPVWDVDYNEMSDFVDANMAKLNTTYNDSHYQRTLQCDIVKTVKKSGLNQIDTEDCWNYIKEQYKRLAGDGVRYDFQFQYLYESKENFASKSASSTARQREALRRGPPEVSELSEIGKKLRERWHCATHGLCFIVEGDIKHYRIHNTFLDQWCQAIMAGDATNDKPPAEICLKLVVAKNATSYKNEARTGIANAAAAFDPFSAFQMAQAAVKAKFTIN